MALTHIPQVHKYFLPVNPKVMFATRAAARTVVRTATRASSTLLTPAVASSSSNAWSKLALVGAGAASIYAIGTDSSSVKCDALPVYGVAGTNQERTFLAVKPDGVQRGLVGDIIARFEKRGYKLVGLKVRHSRYRRMAT